MTARVMMVVFSLAAFAGSGMGVASADDGKSKAEPAAKAKAKAKAAAKTKAKAEPAAKTKAESAAAVQAAAPAQPVDPVQRTRKVDPLEAALAQAMAHSVAPVEVKKKSARRGRGNRGLKGVARFAKTAAKANLGVWSHSKQLPVHEQVVRMDVQPLASAEVTAVIKANTRKIQYCHERLAARGQAVNGAVSVKFTIHPKGHPTNISVAAGGTHARELEQCIAARIRALKFPAADAPTLVEYPFVFDVAGSSVEPSK